MVVFVDLDSEEDDPISHPKSAYLGTLRPIRALSQPLGRDGRVKDQEVGVGVSEKVNSVAAVFSCALACYPISLSITAQLDLNDLYSLSITCRAIHQSLSQFAYQLRTQSLRCVNEEISKTSKEQADAIDFHEAIASIIESSMPMAMGSAFPNSLNSDAGHFHTGQHSALGLSGKIGKCARDLVAPCRKCSTVVCRNCAAKPPSDRCLPNRYRRLCRTCLGAPLMDHLRPLDNDMDSQESPPASSASSACSVRSFSSHSSQSYPGSVADTSVVASTPPVFLRDPCACAARGVFLCQPCGQSLNASDTTYKRVWTWRSRYSTHIGGGLGTGLGLGNQGQKCGRGEYCLERGVGGVCWVEIECSEAQSQGRNHDEGLGPSRSSTPLAGPNDQSDGTVTNRPGYFSQELEGIGGVLKKKVKKRIKVGATVYEFDDERATGKYLLRESTGKVRSWCGWCSRVCPGEDDKADLEKIMA